MWMRTHRVIDLRLVLDVCAQLARATILPQRIAMRALDQRQVEDGRVDVDGCYELQLHPRLGVPAAGGARERRCVYVRACVPECVTHSRKGLRSSIDRPAASAGQADGRSLEASPYLMEALAPLF